MSKITTTLPLLEVSTRAAHQIEQGNLWIFSNEIIRKSSSLAPGTWVQFNHEENPLGVGYFNGHSLIAGRLVSSGIEDDISDLLSRQLFLSFERRREMIKGGSVRLVYSEADFLPGMILDWYSGVAVLQSSTAGIDTVLPLLETIIPDVFNRVFGFPLEYFIIKADTSIRELEGISSFVRIVKGNEALLSDRVFKEQNIHYAADFIHGQKTGFFLDQRDNRATVGRLVQEHSFQSVLDLFCYSGGWGLRALASGADHVTFVDQSKEALALVAKGLDLNSISASKALTIDRDVFDFLEENVSLYDVVVSDPPAFVKSKKVIPQAMRAYEKLTRLAWRRVKPGGVLMASSCSYHLSESDFLSILKMAVGKEMGMAHLIYRGFQAKDHPVLLAMPETSYLKCVGLRKI